jgi:hypothetical protein
MRQLSQADEDALLDAAVSGLNDRRSGGPHDSGHGQPFLLKRHQAVTLSGAAEVSARRHWGRHSPSKQAC